MILMGSINILDNLFSGCNRKTGPLRMGIGIKETINILNNLSSGCNQKTKNYS